MLCLVAAAYFVTRALQEDRLRWILLTGVMIGLGRTDQVADRMDDPAGGGGQLSGRGPNPMHPSDRVRALLGVVVVIGSLWWPTAVDLVPKSNRPFVESSDDDSELNLVLVTDGLDRVIAAPVVLDPHPAPPTAAVKPEAAAPPVTGEPRTQEAAPARRPVRRSDRLAAPARRDLLHRRLLQRLPTSTLEASTRRMAAVVDLAGGGLRGDQPGQRDRSPLLRQRDRASAGRHHRRRVGGHGPRLARRSPTRLAAPRRHRDRDGDRDVAGPAPGRLVALAGSDDRRRRGRRPGTDPPVEGLASAIG